MTFDPRLTPARPDLAAAHLQGQVEAARFVAGSAMRVAAAAPAPLTSQPNREAPLASELLHGEPFTVYDEAEGYAWGQSGWDGYVGWVPSAALAPPSPAGAAARPMRVALPHGALTYPAPEVKAPPARRLPTLAAVGVVGQSGRWMQLEQGDWIPGRHLTEDLPLTEDWVAFAGQFLGVPYLWGGRSQTGLDCSALIQLSRMAAGRDCPRDSDMQQALGEALPMVGPFRRGDLVFWKGHVGVMEDPDILLHANAFHMAVAREPLALARDRIAAQGGGAITAARRPV